MIAVTTEPAISLPVSIATQRIVPVMNMNITVTQNPSPNFDKSIDTYTTATIHSIANHFFSRAGVAQSQLSDSKVLPAIWLSPLTLKVCRILYFMILFLLYREKNHIFLSVFHFSPLS
jgi:hypothetical protein